MDRLVSLQMTASERIARVWTLVLRYGDKSVSTTESDDYKDLLRIFNAFGVEYLIVGAHALAAHGHPRYSEDFDIWVRPHSRQRVSCLQSAGGVGAPMEDVGSWTSLPTISFCKSESHRCGLTYSRQLAA